MKKAVLFLVVSIAIIMNLKAQSDVSQARWKTREIIIDGNDNEWVKPLNFYDDKSGLMFAICNDTQNLYFCFTSNDETKMKKMMSAGWSVNLSSKEKNKKFNSEVIFPGVNVMGIGRGQGSANEKRAVGSNLIKTYKSQISGVSAKGFNSNYTELKLNDRNGIDIAIGADSTQHIVYEIAIPLKELFLKDLISLNELITMNVKVNALERPNTQGGFSGGGSGMSGGRRGGGMSGGGGRMGGGGGRMGGGMSGGGGRQVGGMSRGGVYGGGFGDRAGLYEKASFKQKFTLVGKQ